MGIKIDRFIGDIDSNFICSICNDVLEDPLQAPVCEHAFCKICILEWLYTNHFCPLDREHLTIGDLKPFSRILRSFLYRLTLTCNNQLHGCPAIVALEELDTHLLECGFNPKRLVSCNSGCGKTMHFSELASHNCLQSLRIEMEKMSERLDAFACNLDTEMERVERANKDQMLMIESELESLEKIGLNSLKEMTKIRTSISNLLQVDRATIKKKHLDFMRDSSGSHRCSWTSPFTWEDGLSIPWKMSWTAKKEFSSESRNELYSIFMESSLDDAIAQAQERIPSDKKRLPGFVQDVVTVITRICLKGDSQHKEFDKNQFYGWLEFIYNLTSCNLDLELQALYAVQSIANELAHPKGFINDMTEIFSSCLSDLGFILWRGMTSKVAVDWFVKAGSWT